jgi:serine/threonine-protein kinase
MAEVYLAISETQGFSKLQVLKMLRPDLNEDERTEFIQMFQDEGRLAARLNHPHIVQSHDVGFEAAQPFIAMEYLDGQPLSRVQERIWKQQRELSWGMHLLPLCQVLDALEYAHNLTDYDGTPLHIVHRDVSPQNVFVTYTGHTKLVDFGIAKTLESCKTRAGVVKGKVPYMSPEQVVGQPVDHRTDLFSVGVILWETIAKRPMHGTEAMFQILSRVVRGDLPNLREVNPNTPKELVEICERALAVNPADRYPDAATFRQDLDHFIQASGRASANEIGSLVSELFAAERSEVKDAIKRAMARPSGEAANWERDTLRLPPTLSMLTSRTMQTPTFGHAPASSADLEPSVAMEPRSVRTDMEQVPDTAPYDQHQTAKPVHRDTGMTLPSKPRIPLLGAAVAVVLAGFVIAVAASKGKTPPSVAAAATPGIGASTQVGTGSAAQSVQFVAKVHPPNAQLSLDGVVLGQGSYAGSLPVDTASHQFSARAPGYQPHTRELRLDKDVDVVVNLTPSPSPRSNPTPNPSPRSGKAAAPTQPEPVAAPGRRPDPYDKDFSAPKRAVPAPLDTEDPF